MAKADKKSETEEVVSKEIAVQELQSFVEKWDDKKKEDWQIEQDYPDVLKAMQLGLLVLDKDLKPKYTLRYPILTDEQNVALGEVEFRTRIRPQQLSDIMKGLDIGKNQIEYTLRCFSFLTQQPKAMIDKLEKFDYKVIDQISTVFL